MEETERGRGMDGDAFSLEQVGAADLVAYCAYASLTTI
jgi:hypothetical protein